MIEARDARIVRKDVARVHPRIGVDHHIYASCWHCPSGLGEILPPDRMVQGVWAIAVPEYYVPEPIPDALAAVGIRSIIVITPRARENLIRTGLPWRRKRGMDKDGGVRVLPSRRYELPTLMPCRRPGCGAPNRILTPE